MKLRASGKESGATGMEPDGIRDIVVRAVNTVVIIFHIYMPMEKGKKPANYGYPGIGWESAANYFTKYYEYN